MRSKSRYLVGFMRMIRRSVSGSPPRSCAGFRSGSSRGTKLRLRVAGRRVGPTRLRAFDPVRRAHGGVQDAAQRSAEISELHSDSGRDHREDRRRDRSVMRELEPGGQTDGGRGSWNKGKDRKEESQSGSQKYIDDDEHDHRSPQSDVAPPFTTHQRRGQHLRSNDVTSAAPVLRPTQFRRGTPRRLQLIPRLTRRDRPDANTNHLMDELDGTGSRQSRLRECPGRKCETAGDDGGFAPIH